MIPGLVKPVDTAVEDIDKHKSDYDSLRQLVDTKLPSSGPLKGVGVATGKIQHLEELNVNLSS